MLFSVCAGSKLAAARHNDTLGVTENRDTIVLSWSLETLLPESAPPSRVPFLIQGEAGGSHWKAMHCIPPLPHLYQRTDLPLRESAPVTRDDWGTSLQMEPDGMAFSLSCRGTAVGTLSHSGAQEMTSTTRTPMFETYANALLCLSKSWKGEDGESVERDWRLSSLGVCFL